MWLQPSVQRASRLLARQQTRVPHCVPLTHTPTLRFAGEAPVGVVGKMTIERAEEPQEPAATTATKHEAGQVGGVSVPAEAATADRSAATGQAEKAVGGGKEAAMRAAFGWARRHASEDEGEDGGSSGSKAAAPTAAAATPAPAVEKKGSGQEKGKKGAATKKNKASKAEGSKADGIRPGSSGKAALNESAAAAKPSKEEGEEGAPAQPAAADKPGGSSGTGSGSSNKEAPNPHAPVGMEAGDYPSQTPVSRCTHGAHFLAHTTQHYIQQHTATTAPVLVQAHPSLAHPSTCTAHSAPCPPRRLVPLLHLSLTGWARSYLLFLLQMGKRPDDTTSGVPAGGLKPSTEAAVKQELRKAVRWGCCCCCLQRLNHMYPFCETDTAADVVRPTAAAATACEG